MSSKTVSSKYSRSEQKKQRLNSNETSESIDKQIQQFLKAGGQIQQINPGVSGQQDTKGPKHISLSKSSPAK